MATHFPAAGAKAVRPEVPDEDGRPQDPLAKAAEQAAANMGMQTGMGTAKAGRPAAGHKECGYGDIRGPLVLGDRHLKRAIPSSAEEETTGSETDLRKRRTAAASMPAEPVELEDEAQLEKVSLARS